MAGRKSTSPYRYDRAAIRLVLETEGRDAALARWPQHAVDPIARILGLTKKYRPRDAWKPEWAALIGTKPDSVLAGELGVPVCTIARQRRLLGIPAMQPASIRVFRRDRLRRVLDQITDGEIAEALEPLSHKYGVSLLELRGERRRRGLSATSERGRRIQFHDSDLRRVAACAIFDAFPDVTLERVAGVLGVTRERVRQILYLHRSAAS